MLRIKEIAIEQRPRERLKAKGIDSLNDSELLAIILQNGTNGENVIDLSHRLIASFGLEKLNSLSLTELMKIKGIKLGKASKLIATFELNKRINSGKICEKVVKNPSDIASYYIEKLKDLKKEHFIAVFLDSKNKIIKDEVISIGTLNSSLVHPREVFKEAIKHSANSIILVHNHPSGLVEPSDEDYRINKILVETGNLVGIKVLDHLVVGNKEWITLN
ncbi:DNA repair protein RadC [Candidatus Woesearchaeota archaeon]|nr:DNA repair protein RadC [Candidatus Woesearchaeota archaeon]